MKEKCNVGECLKILGIDGEKRRVKEIKKKNTKWQKMEIKKYIKYNRFKNYSKVIYKHSLCIMTNNGGWANN